MKIPSPLIKTIMFVVRTVLGATFIFSGFVKAIDPKGTGYKIADYLSAMNFATPDWLDIPLIMGGILICIEFVIGIYLFLGLRRRFTATITLMAMVVFTLVSVLLLIWHPVSNCGCFGDLIVMTDGETLAKNLILLTLSVILFIFPRRAPTLVPHGWHWLISLYSCLFILTFTIVSAYFLPMIDFRPYKIGTNLREKIYPQDLNVTSDDDAMVDFFVTDSLNEDYTQAILMDSTYVFLAISPSLSDADFSVTEDFNALNDWCIDNGYKFYCLTSSSASDIKSWCYYNDAQYPFLFADNLTLKTMIRSNPGLMIIHNGVIRNKWSVHNMPQLAGKEIDLKSFEDSNRSTTTMMLLIVFWYIVPLLALILLSNILHGIKCLITPRKKDQTQTANNGSSGNNTPTANQDNAQSQIANPTDVLHAPSANDSPND